MAQPRGKRQIGRKVTWWEMVTEFVPGSRQVAWKGRKKREGKFTAFHGRGAFTVERKGKKTNVMRDYLTLGGK